MPRFSFPQAVRAAALLACCYFFASCGQPDAGSGCADDCLTPPLPVCNGATLITFSFLGECIDARCQYSPVQTTCGFGCTDGACQTAPLCDTDCPDRAAECDDDVAVRFESAGCDTAGTCLYDEEREDCVAIGRICDQGACIVALGPCDGVDCSVPPASFCAGETAVAFEAVECVDGECPWVEVQADCARVGRACIDGECVSRCGDVECSTPPPGFCDGIVAVNYDAGGRCVGTDGSCQYDPSLRVPCNENLGGRCISGQCIEGRACSEGCDQPPPSFCNTDIAVRFEAGACVDGLCSFAEVVEDCGALGQRCFDGFCSVEPPCAGITCDEAPSPYCDQNTVVAFEEFGSCAGGECNYQTLRTNCAELDGACIGGVCRTDLCDDIVCPEPAAPFCSGNVVVAAQPGVCAVTGACSYATARTDCSLSGSACVDGACVDACVGVTCGDAPAAFCSGSIAVRPSGEGTCFRGNCTYAEERENCRAAGLFCEAGACVTDSPCRGVVCDFPPADYCLGTVRHTYASSGECADGTCGYDPETYDCALSGEACSLGRCVDACLGDPCDRAPAPVCEDTDTLRVANPVGTCISERCQYATALLDCETPPAGFCDGQLAVTFDADGSCSTGECRYPRVYLDCPSTPGGQCLDGACVTVDPCDAVTCDTPPPSRCEGNLELSYESEGTCRLGVCTYALVVDDCSSRAGGTCEDGACVDPCESVECPATGVCFGDVSRQADEPGTCVAGTCEYDWTRDVPCNAIAGGTCEDGYCVDPCEGNTCEAPPAPTCTGNTVNTWQTPGTCEAGTCNYIAVNVSCDVLRGGTCVDGACVTECDDGCEAPPAATCNGNLAFTYAAAGGCESGQCSYPLTVLDCAATPGGTCVDGACVDPCDSVVCNTPPAGVCVETLAITYPEIGTCYAGVCAYEPIRDDCGSVLGGTCVDAACVDPCEGIVCNTPPGAVCNGGTLEGWAPLGICELGACSYTRVNTSCDALLGGSCVGNACVTECDGGCNAPPPGFCDGGVARRFVPAGSCVSGRCEYAEVQEDCPAEPGGVCVGQGVCVNPCQGVTCEPPAPRCDDVFAVTVEQAGFCDRGACRFEESYEDCSAVAGGFCRGGACVDPCDAISCDDAPAGICDGTTFIGYEPFGECFAGECTHLNATPIDCEEFFNGLCAVDGCLTECDLGCPDTPQPVCDVDSLVTYAPVGCDEGRCQYGETRTNCITTFGSNFRCIEEGGVGSCVDLCDGVVCDAFEPSTCEDGVFEYTAPGVCSAGVCQYRRETEPCPGPTGDVCNGGVCVIDPRCSALDCSEVPEPACLAGALISRIRYEPGPCRAGACEFVEVLESCPEATPFCLNGVCQAEGLGCDDIVCNDVPQNRCEGNVAVQYAPGLGACTVDATGFPVCDYASLRTTTNCADTIQLCVDAECVSTVAPNPGDLVITEIMARPLLDDTEAEWIEIHNTAANFISLSDVSLRSVSAPATAFLLSGAIAPGAYRVVGRPRVFEDRAPDIAWTGSFTLGDTSGGIELVRGSTTLDSVVWDASWPVRAGLSMSLRELPDTTTNDAPASWCPAPEFYGISGRGTPGAAHRSCLLSAATSAALDEILITEFSTSETNGSDWFELRSNSPFAFDLAGVTIRAGAQSLVVGPVVLGTDTALVVSGAADVSGRPTDIRMANLDLSPAGGTITLEGGAGLISALGYTSPLWPTSGTRSTQVDQRFNNSYAFADGWCLATTALGGGRFGTPGQFNDFCPGLFDFCAMDGDCGPQAYCSDGFLFERTSAGTCDETRGQCVNPAGSVVVTDCFESGQSCFNRDCRDE